QAAINVPTAGSVLVIATGDLTCSTCATNTEQATVSLFVTNNPNGTATNDSILQLSGPITGASSEVHSATNHRVFAVNPGSNTFYFRGNLLIGTTKVMRVLRGHISVIFSPL